MDVCMCVLCACEHMRVSARVCVCVCELAHVDIDEKGGWGLVCQKAVLF